MTIGVAWIRQGNREAEELLVATDSRLGGDGYIWDECPKITPLPRRDALAAFSGSTAQAYPLLLQIANAIRAYRPAEDGTLEFFEVIGHLERVANTMMGTLVVDPALRGSHTVGRQFATSGDVVIVGGYSRRRAKVVLRALQFDGAAAWRFARVRGAPSVGGRTMRVTAEDASSGAAGGKLDSFLFYSPEKLSGVKNLTAVTDLFALRATLFYLLTGQYEARLPEGLVVASFSRPSQDV